jgi:hypothetical protein
VGAKAAQLAELSRVMGSTACPGPIPTPPDAFAIPVVHFMEHFEASGAKAHLLELEADPQFQVSPNRRAEGLHEVQALILDHPVDPALLAEVEQAIRERFGTQRVRLRSSSNTEDLPGFNGAGLYTSTSAALDDPERPLEPALRTVWASLFNPRAYDERSYFNIDGSTVAMGVLCHAAFLSEDANGVIITRNVLEPTRSDIYYLNVQAGEATVTNPAPGVTSDQLLLQLGSSIRVETQGRSSLVPGPVLTDAELSRAACLARAAHQAFKALLDPDGLNRWFALDIEFKLEDDTRWLVFKQARPYSFGSAEIPADCREF